MALVPETGSGVPGADAYAARATVLAYWVNRPHSAFAATVAAADVNDMDGAIREATDYLDAEFGQYYRGVRAGRVQGKLWPRTNALDDAGFPLTGLPQELVDATCELAGRAVSATLADDEARGGLIKRLKAGSVEIEYADGAQAGTVYGIVSKMLVPILDGSQGGKPQWIWR